MVERRLSGYDMAANVGSSRPLVVSQGVPTNGRYLRGACGTCRSPWAPGSYSPPGGEYD